MKPQIYTVDTILEAAQGKYVFADGRGREWFVVLESKESAVSMLRLDPKGLVFGPLPELG